MRPKLDHTYRGRLIRPCVMAPGEHQGPWVIVAHHKASGMRYSDDVLAHCQTLAHARDVIDLWHDFVDEA